MSALSRRGFLLGSGALGIAGASAAGLGTLTPLALLAGCTPSSTTLITDTWLILGQTVDKNVRMPAGRPTADGLCSIAFNSETGKLAEVNSLNGSIWAEVVLADATNGVVYACDKCVDNPDFADKGGGGDVYSYAFSRDGTAVKLDSSLSYGANPSALVLSADGNFLGTAIAGGGGTATVLKTNEKGLLEVGFCYSERSFVLRQIEHDGSVGAVSDRYLLNPDGVPSAPCDVKRAPSGEFFLLCDRDASTLYSFKLRPESGELYLGADPFVEPDGSRASRCVFHPTGPWAYASSADLPQLLALSYEENGALTQTQNVAPIERPEMYDARSDDYRYTQDFLCASADGRFVYCGARLSKGINSEYELVAVFSVDAQSGLLTPLQYYFLENAQGACAAALSPDGRWLVVACRYSCELLTLRVADDGRLELHDRYSVATPSSICWYKHE